MCTVYLQLIMHGKSLEFMPMGQAQKMALASRKEVPSNAGTLSPVHRKTGDAIPVQPTLTGGGTNLSYLWLRALPRTVGGVCDV